MPYTIRPENTAAVSGNTTRFTCASTDPPLSWFFESLKPEFVTVIRDCRLNPQLEQIYGVGSTENGLCDLIIKSPTRAEAGRYGCSAGFDNAVTAEFVVIGS